SLPPGKDEHVECKNESVGIRAKLRIIAPEHALGVVEFRHLQALLLGEPVRRVRIVRDGEVDEGSGGSIVDVQGGEHKTPRDIVEGHHGIKNEVARTLCLEE